MKPEQIHDAAERLLTVGHYDYWECNWQHTNARTDAKTVIDALREAQAEISRLRSQIEGHAERIEDRNG